MRKFAFCLVVIVTVTLAIDLPCRYDVATNFRTKDLYICELNNSLTIPNNNSHITSVTGKHMTQKSNADVAGFRVRNKTLHYLPRGLEKYFNADKIEFLELQATGLKEIHLIDLKPFTEMNFFSAWSNDLQVLERDLFKFNPKLRFIGLGRNKIKFIAGNVFDLLSKLQILYLDGNRCTSAYINAEEEDGDYKAKLSSLLDHIWSSCTN